jgi:hypothetical protein
MHGLAINTPTKGNVLEQHKLWASLPIRFGKPQGSALHRLLAADIAGPDGTGTAAHPYGGPREHGKLLSGIISSDGGGPVDCLASGLSGSAWAKVGARNEPWFFHRAPPLLVCHDWAGLLGDEAKCGDYRLPFPDTTVEFLVSGVHVIVFARDRIDTVRPIWYSCAEFGRTWIANYGNDKLSNHLEWQLRAMCLALEADVADAVEEVRPSSKLNAKRLSTGKEPLATYRVVNLARHHISKASTRTGTGSRPRLHWVRGYWKTIPRRTWVKTYIRGNPELGFINKEYRL